MVAQKQTLLAALPPDNPLSTASQIQSQSALDKQVDGSRLSQNVSCPGKAALSGSSRRYTVADCIA
jgi:hypothetical protein